MMPETNTEDRASHFAPGVELLREFFRSRGVSFGEAEHLRALAARLASPGSFYEDMSSTLRAIVLRERVGVTQGELLELVCLVAGGRHYSEAEPPLDAETGQLLVFVNVVLLSVRKRAAEANLESGAAPELAPERQHPARAQEEISATTKATPPKVPASTERVSARSHAVASRDEPVAPPEKQPRQSLFEPTTPTLLPPRSQRRSLLSKPASFAAAAVLILLASAMLWHRRPSSGKQLVSPDSVYQKEQVPPAHPEAVPETARHISPANGNGAAEGDGSTAASESIAPLKFGAGKPLAGTPASGAAATESARDGDSTSAPSTTDLDRTPTSNSIAGTRSLDRGPTAEPPRTRDAFSAQHSSRKGLISVSSGVMGANLIAAPPPEYPLLAKVTRIEGQVILQAVVSRRGTVVSAHALQGHRLLRSAAENCVRKWRYRPYLVDGRPTDIDTIVFVNFQLHH